MQSLQERPVLQGCLSSAASTSGPAFHREEDQDYEPLGVALHLMPQPLEHGQLRALARKVVASLHAGAGIFAEIAVVLVCCWGSGVFCFRGEFCSHMFQVPEVDQILYQWCHAKRSPPSARSLSALVKADRRVVWRFLSFLRDKTAAAAATQALKPVLDQKGLVAKEKAAVYEVDGTHIGKFYISARSRTWASEIKAWEKRHGKLPKYFQVHSRVVGLTSRRTGALWIQPLSLKLIPPSGRPPQEGHAELRQSKIFERLPPRTCLMSDGARAFAAVLRTDYAEKKVVCKAVNHRRNQFTRRVRLPNGKTCLAGTQQLDSLWCGMKRWISAGCRNKANQTLNPERMAWARSFVWRHNARLTEGIENNLAHAVWA